MGQYKHHVFVCTSGGTCPGQGSDLVFAALKKGAAAAGIQNSVRVNHAGCMGQCGNGPMVAVYPGSRMVLARRCAGAEQILHEHLDSRAGSSNSTATSLHRATTSYPNEAELMQHDESGHARRGRAGKRANRQQHTIRGAWLARSRSTESTSPDTESGRRAHDQCRTRWRGFAARPKRSRGARPLSGSADDLCRQVVPPARRG